MDKELEDSMMPGMLSSGGFLGRNEKLEDVLREDDKTVKKLGLTHEKIADRIAYLIDAIGYPRREGKLIDGKYLVGGIVFRGGQKCPWGDAGFMMPNSNVDLYVQNQETGERLDFPGGIVHLIREHHFYEGKKSPYRVDPELAARVLNIK
ncbi:hypothetical protein JW756_04040 [Candidatus Woesearchaeota archaeon]|nr:hypothetical protein [Candidatus Woesearchaeota archaeon]